jgi:hypothetical protein
MAQNMEGADGITEGASDLLGRTAFYEIGSKGFVHAVLGVPRFKKEAANCTYVFWCA